MPKVKMGSIAELATGSALEKRILARRVAVVNDNGTLYAIEADCKHMKASLATGRVVNGTVTCRWHGWKYDLATGACLTNDRFALKTYRVELVDDTVYVHI